MTRYCNRQLFQQGAGPSDLDRLRRKAGWWFHVSNASLWNHPRPKTRSGLLWLPVDLGPRTMRGRRKNGGKGRRKTRRGRESNPRIGVLQTPALPLGYPAKTDKTPKLPCGSSLSTQRPPPAPARDFSFAAPGPTASVAGLASPPDASAFHFPFEWASWFLAGCPPASDFPQPWSKLS